MENTNNKLIIVSNRLPIQLNEKNGKIILKESDGGLVSSLKSYFERAGKDSSFKNKVWIGAADFPELRWNKYLKKKEVTTSFEIEPLFVENKSYNRFYNGFCNATLWPLFHYFPSFVDFDEDTFRSYEEVNQLFCDKILSILEPGDTLWIHDYQLMLLPGMIRDKMPDLAIGFFLHIPFPSYEIFRLLHRHWKEKIINGLLGADLIGFHTHEYVQHFLTCVRMISGFDHQYRSITLKNKVIKTDLFPLGIDFDKFYEPSDSPQLNEQKKYILSNFKDRKIIFSVDRLDYTKGITHRLSGLERFLELYPNWREQVVFILVVVPSRQIVSKYNERRKLIEEQVGRLNGKYSTLQWQPIIYRYNNLDFNELSALYQTADVALITPLRDGMNLVAKEYVASRADQTGVLILSELAGAANELSEALQVNPMDRDDVANSISTALAMPVHEQQQKMQLMQKRLKDYDVVHWVGDFFKQLSDSKEMQEMQKTKYITKMTVVDLRNKICAATKKLLFLDYDGTLVPFTKHPSGAKPTQELLDFLRNLTIIEGMEIVIISGRNYQTLFDYLGELPIHLIAEHGASVKLNGNDWVHEKTSDDNWKDLIFPILDLFTKRSPGSFLEEKSYSLAWHYRGVDSELGFIRSRELLDNLFHMVRNAHLNVIDGNKVIEIRVAGVDKGSAAMKMMDLFQPEFILAVGDDKTDEDMFKVVNQNSNGATVKVGNDITNAQFNLPMQSNVLPFIEQLTKSL